MAAQELEGGDNLHTVSSDEERGRVISVLPEVYISQVVL